MSIKQAEGVHWADALRSLELFVHETWLGIFGTFRDEIGTSVEYSMVASVTAVVVADADAESDAVGDVVARVLAADRAVEV